MVYVHNLIYKNNFHYHMFQVHVNVDYFHYNVLKYSFYSDKSNK